MLIEKLSSDTPVRAGLGLDDLSRLQWAQFEHDEKFHREIARLTVQDRLKHMALHFAKYSGGLAEGPSEDELCRLVTDVFVIGLSSANILNLKLADRHNELSSAANVDGDGDFATKIAIASGRLAAACEKMDHLEAFPFREKITEEVLALLGAAISFADGRGWDLPSMVAKRLQPVKEKNIFYGKL
ncbi:hypothetical protein A3718_08355 [Erythrobacter sp. HI0019]|uniref:hypothetical protein n=1 Tax=unclassified Erythrobacter TaxID=2633097 RepID=UPI0007B83BC1|nr:MULTISPECIES: hypothetical protein [unclassified Erythrobacter]KZX93920.1 hypothetical protein A3718_08355 [Erythrobacter sp. HI0019]KZY09115.1 hypothetical protein A3723_10720 [Erythrobacter sp. HI0028]